MAVNVVKDIRLLDIVELVLRADKGTRRKPAIGKMFKKDVIGNKVCYRNNAPAREFLQPV